ncbi:MAG: SurA N-terminal domain-containing protein [Polyangiales bacterium]
MTPRRLRVHAALLFVAGLCLATPARADVVERVVAVVNDEAIFLSQLRTRAAPFLDRVMAAPSQTERIERLEQLYREVLDQLIDEELIKQTAASLSLRVTQAEIERALANVQQQNNLTPEQFWQAVREQGYTEAGYRADLQRQLLRMKVINQRVRSRVNVTEADVRREYDQEVRRMTRTVRYHASHLFLPLAENATEAEVEDVRERAVALRATLSDEASFEAATETVVGGELGWLTQGDLPESLERVVFTMEPGQISDPVRGPAGFHIFLLHERARGDEQAPEYDSVRENIYRQLLDQAMNRQEQLFLEELRRDATITRRL